MKRIELKAVKKKKKNQQSPTRWTYLEEGNIVRSKEGTTESLQVLANKIKAILRVAGSVFGDGSNDKLASQFTTLGCSKDGAEVQIINLCLTFVM